MNGSVSDRLGHASAGFTLNVYGHAVPGAQLAAASKLAELLNGPITEKPLNISHKVHAEVQGGLAGDVILADTREGGELGDGPGT